MKDLSLLVWVTQLGLSVGIPLAGFIFLAVWLRNRLALGSWIIWCGIVLGLLSAIKGLYATLWTLSRLSQGKEEKDPPPVSFNDHI